LIGGEGKAEFLLVQPGGELAGSVDF
jgi:hypothetical protein